jgi:uncharacterized RDD family membrane protein YckC
VPTALSGRTAGKLVVGTRVVDIASGEHPSWAMSVVRSLPMASLWLAPLTRSAIGSASGAVVAVAMYAPTLWQRQGQGLHDRLSRTIVRFPATRVSTFDDNGVL